MIVYAIELFFDSATEKAVKKIWEGLSKSGIDASMIKIVTVYLAPIPTMPLLKLQQDLHETSQI